MTNDDFSVREASDGGAVVRVPAMTTHVVLLESRYVYAISKHGSESRYRAEPLAHLRLEDTELTHTYLAATLAEHITVDNETYLIGRAAEQLSEMIPDLDGPDYPFDRGDLRRAPDASWRSVIRTIELAMGSMPMGSGSLLALVPTPCEKDSSLWLRALPEALLGDRHPNLRSVSMTTPLLENVARSGLVWAWVIGDRGVSIEVQYAGARRGAYLRQGVRSVLAKVDATTSRELSEIVDSDADGPRRKTCDIFTRDLLDKALALSIQQFPKAWSGELRPSITLRVVAPPTLVESVDRVLPRVISKYATNSEFATSVLSYCELLEHALGERALQPSSPSSETLDLALDRPRTPPQAVRPRRELM